MATQPSPQPPKTKAPKVPNIVDPLAQILGALGIKGREPSKRDVILTGGLAPVIQAIKGPGAGQLRRREARSIVGQTPELARARSLTVQGVPLESVLSTLRTTDPGASLLLAGLVQEAIRLGPGKGTPNLIGDVLKYTLLGETVTKRRLPELPLLLDMIGAPLSSVPVPATPGQVTPYQSIFQQLRDALSGSGGGGVPMNSDWLDSFGSFVGGVGQALPGIAALVSATRGGRQMNSPMFQTGGWGNALGNYNVPIAIGEQYPITMQGAGASSVAASGGAFRSPSMRATPQMFFLPNPATGALTWFRPAGKPVLWSSDLSACRRVRKVAARARRRVGGR